MTEGSGDVPLVALRGITKRYGDLLANDDVHLGLRSGEVHTLLGENGAGKSTLMRILYGMTRPDAGEILIDGEPVAIASPKDAITAGIGMVTQHFSLVRPMTVAENILLTDARLGPTDLRQARARVRETAAQIGLEVDPDARVADLSIGEQQQVEILKALYHRCRVLILDEPTAVLVPQDVEALFATIQQLAASGLGTLFVSHKLNEVTRISDRVSVLRNGRVVETVSDPAAVRDAARLAERMVGRPLRPDASVALGGAARSAAGTAPPRDTVALSLAGITVAGRGVPALDGLSLQVHRHEIVGVAGVSGNGQRELVDVLSGLTVPERGTVQVAGQDVTTMRPDQRAAAGLGCVGEDRHGSVVGAMSVEHNLVLDRLEDFRNGLGLGRRRIRRHAEELIDRFSIKASPTDPVGQLSGGNVQKVLLARVLSRDPEALVVAQPTRGLDVGACDYVHGELRSRRDAGVGVLMVSEDLDELLGLADRIVVLFAGRIAGELPVVEATRERLGLMMTGAAA